MWYSLINSVTTAMRNGAERRRAIKAASDESLATGPSWRYRRRLIHGAYIIGIAMIIFGGFTVFTQSQVGVEMIIGGVALVSIIITAYTTSATYEDVRLWNHNPRIRFGESEDIQEYNENSDG